jgi:hypothetical protein
MFRVSATAQACEDDVAGGRARRMVGASKSRDPFRRRTWISVDVPFELRSNRQRYSKLAFRTAPRSADIRPTRSSEINVEVNVRLFDRLLGGREGVVRLFDPARRSSVRQEVAGAPLSIVFFIRSFRSRSLGKLSRASGLRRGARAF